MEDLGGVIRDEIKWLAAAGVRYIQLDAPYYSHYLDAGQRDRMRSAGRDPPLRL